MKLAVMLIAAALGLSAQTTYRFSATTGDVSLSGAGTTATLQQVANTSGQTQAYIDQLVVYCSVACNVSLAANGTAATATAGTVQPLLPTQLLVQIPLTFWTASNVGAGTTQGGITHVPAGGTVVLCFSPTCGAAQQVSLATGQGTGSNYSATISSITGTANVTFYGRSVF